MAVLAAAVIEGIDRSRIIGGSPLQCCLDVVAVLLPSDTAACRHTSRRLVDLEESKDQDFHFLVQSVSTAAILDPTSHY